MSIGERLRNDAKAFARTTGGRVLRTPWARRTALRSAAARGHGLVLLYHRVAPEGAQPQELVRTVRPAALRRQLAALAEMADIVGLHDLVGEHRPGRVRAAITFDDDDPRFVDHVLPVLDDLGVTATFFLSGRTLHGLGPYWWELLEAEIADVGLAAAAQRRGTVAATPFALARSIIDGTVAADPDPAYAPEIRQLQPAEMRRTAEAGMTIGWHSLEHPSFPTLSDVELAETLTRGRAELAATVGQPLDLFAYPYARFDERSGPAARAAGFTAAFTGIGAPVTRRAPRWTLGRWEPVGEDLDTFVSQFALRVARPVLR